VPARGESLQGVLADRLKHYEPRLAADVLAVDEVLVGKRDQRPE
jgi:hypothetical protein